MMRLKVANYNTWYRAEWVTTEEAEAVGVEDANLRFYSERLAGVAGCDGWTYGLLVSSGRVPGALVRVPSSGGERGVRSRFFYGDEVDNLDVYLVR